MALIWSFGGTLLSTYGRVTLINDYLDLPERRGENMTLPYRDGVRFVPKFYNERIMTFGLAVMTENALDLETTMDSLRASLALRTQQILSYTREDASTRTALASVNSRMLVERHGSRNALMVIEFELTEPFFRLDTLSTTTITIDGSPKTGTVANAGTVEERNPTITLTGPLTNPVITNTTNGVSLTYTGAISAGDTVIIAQDASGQYTAAHSVSGNVIGNVTHAGDTALMVLAIGNNSMSITSSVATTGTVKFEFYPPYL